MKATGNREGRARGWAEEGPELQAQLWGKLQLVPRAPLLECAPELSPVEGRSWACESQGGH